MIDVQKFIEDNNEWSVKTFGPCSPIPVLSHLEQEVKEVITAITKKEGLVNTSLEFADCFILLMQAAHKAGFSFEDILYAAKFKMNINKLRSWGAPDEKGVVNHER